MNDSIILSKIHDGGIYKQLILYNNTSIIEKSNNIFFQIDLIRNVSNINIIIKNQKKLKFYWRLYRVEKYKKIDEIKRITLPLFDSKSNVKKFDYYSDNVIISQKNPLFNWGDINKDCYFFLSYDQNFENIIENPYEIKIIYNFKILTPNLNINKINILSLNNYENYFLKIENFQKLVIKFSSYDTTKLTFDIFLEENPNLMVGGGEFNDKTTYYILNNKYANDGKLSYILKLFLPFSYRVYSCLIVYYSYTDNQIEYGFPQYNEKSINIDGLKISWPKLNNTKYYKIYIFNNETQFNSIYVDNYCYLQTLTNGTNTIDLTIIKTTNNFYEFEEKTQRLLIKVVGFENDNDISVVYRSDYFNYDKKNNNNTILIILISSGFVILIIFVIIIIICCKRKKQKKDNNDYNISMSEDVNCMNNEKMPITPDSDNSSITPNTPITPY